MKTIWSLLGVDKIKSREEYNKMRVLFFRDSTTRDTTYSYITSIAVREGPQIMLLCRRSEYPSLVIQSDRLLLRGR